VGYFVAISINWDFKVTGKLKKFPLSAFLAANKQILDKVENDPVERFIDFHGITYTYGSELSDAIKQGIDVAQKSKLEQKEDNFFLGGPPSDCHIMFFPNTQNKMSSDEPDIEKSSDEPDTWAEFNILINIRSNKKGGMNIEARTDTRVSHVIFRKRE
jgi:hypothetical protein